jgi:hypothetical protein
VLAEVPFDVIDHHVTLSSAEAAPKELHDARISIHGGKCLPILLTPSA